MLRSGRNVPSSIQVRSTWNMSDMLEVAIASKWGGENKVVFQGDLCVLGFQPQAVHNG